MRKQPIKYYSILLLTYLVAWGCIEPYELPNVADDFVPSLVIDGTISNDDSVQVIIVSETRQLNAPQGNLLNPLSGCHITVSDKAGNQFNYTETSEEGYYQCTIPMQYLHVGNTFKMRLIAPNDNVYESEEEELLPISPVDSIYFSSIQNSEGLEVGISFKVDVKGENDDCRNYKWKLIETYEYHAVFPINYIYRGSAEGAEIRDYDMSQFKCYKSNTISGEIYMISTDKLSENRYLGVPLNSVGFTSRKLKEKYSLLVKQYSLTDGAARFWSEMKDNQKEGGMFDGQPITVNGNIWNINNTDERVLGYFGASMVSQKRVFAQKSSNLAASSCTSSSIAASDLDSLISLSSGSRPLYVVKYFRDTTVTSMFTAPPSCFDCTLNYGHTNKPSYWDSNDITTLLEAID